MIWVCIYDISSQLDVIVRFKNKMFFVSNVKVLMVAHCRAHNCTKLHTIIHTLKLHRYLYLCINIYISYTYYLHKYHHITLPVVGSVWATLHNDGIFRRKTWDQEKGIITQFSSRKKLRWVLTSFLQFYNNV